MQNEIEIRNFCERHEITLDQFTGKERIEGYLDLRSVTSLPEGFNPTVGDYLNLRSGLTAETKEFDSSMPFEWLGGKYILADGEFTEVVSKRGNVRRVKRLGRDKIFYLITDGEGKFAHGDTLADAKESLIYKISNRDTSKYRGVTLDSSLTFAEGVEMYRVITGACAAGTRHFVETTGLKKKAYTVRQIIDMTKGRYGHDRFAEFFNA